MSEIQLANNLGTAMIDDTDYEWLFSYRWYFGEFARLNHVGT